MNDDAVREIHGVHAREVNRHMVKIITIREREDSIILDHIGLSDAEMTSCQARYLASKLYRLARRVRTRNRED